MNESIIDQEKKDLSNAIFIPGKQVMRGKVRNFIMDTAYKWIEKMGFKKDDVEEMVMIGSMTGLHYTENSDIDINLKVKIPDKWIDENHKLLPNGNNIPDTKHPLNYYLITKTHRPDATKKADGAYDVLNDKWLKKEDEDKPKVHYDYAFEIARFFLAGINNRIMEYDIDSKELEILKKLSPEKDKISQGEIDKKISIKEMEVKADLDAIWLSHKILKSLRHAAFKDESLEFLVGETDKPNFTFENIVWKIIYDRLGYDEIFKKYDELRDKWKKA